MSDGCLTALQHDAFVYSTDDEFVERVTPFLHDGVAEGGAAVAVTTRSNWAALREALGRAAEQVVFTDSDECYVRPSKTVASYETALQRLYQAGAPTVRVIGSAGETAARVPRQRVAAGPTDRRRAAGDPYGDLRPHSEEQA